MKTATKSAPLAVVFDPRHLAESPPAGKIVVVKFSRPDDTFADCCHVLREIGRPVYKLFWIDGAGPHHDPAAEVLIAQAVAKIHGHAGPVTVYGDEIATIAGR